MNTYEGLEEKNTAPFLKVHSDGSLRLEVEEGTPKAVKRDWEMDGKTGTKFELIYKSVKGIISNISLYKLEWGTNLVIELTSENGQKINISANADKQFAEDMFAKIPNLDFNKVVTIKPYSFTGKKSGKPIKGVDFVYGVDKEGKDIKTENFFKKWDDDKKTWVYMNGLPEPKGDVEKFSTDKWKAHYLECKIHMTDHFTENIAPQFVTEPVPSEANANAVPSEDEIDADWDE